MEGSGCDKSRSVVSSRSRNLRTNAQKNPRVAALGGGGLHATATRRPLDLFPQTLVFLNVRVNEQLAESFSSATQ